MSEEKLSVKVCYVELTRDLGGMISAMSPKVELKWGDEDLETETCFEQGTKGDFNQEFDLGDGSKSDKLVIKVVSVGTFSNDDVGTCTILADQLKVGAGIREKFTLLHETDSAGVIMLESVYQGPPEAEEPAPVAAPTPAPMIAPPMQTPAPMMQQPMMQQQPQAFNAMPGQQMGNAMPGQNPMMMGGMQQPMMGGMQQPMMGGMPPMMGMQQPMMGGMMQPPMMGGMM